MYRSSQIKKIGPLKFRFCFTKLCASKSLSVSTPYLRFGRKWSFGCTPHNVFSTGLPLHNIDRNTLIFCVACNNTCTLYDCATLAFCSLFAVCCPPFVGSLPPAVYFLHSLSYILYHLLSAAYLSRAVAIVSLSLFTLF
jgi:hypothetical protein